MSKTVLVTGASGMIGTALCEGLRKSGHQPIGLNRDDSSNPALNTWSLKEGRIVLDPKQKIDAVVHLAGKNIAAGRWTESLKKEIRDSRVIGTDLISRKATELDPNPKVFIGASAIGFYGDRGEERLTESSSVGEGFLPEVAQLWENAAQPARDAGIRTVHTRFGVVLSNKGGALAKMLTPFKFGIGGRVGSGKQYMSWVDLDDVVGSIIYCLENESISGPVNVTSPDPVTNQDFSKTLAKVLHRPCLFPLPALAAKLALGEMAEPLLLHSTLVEPEKLLDAGYEFKFPTLESSLRHQLDG